MTSLVNEDVKKRVLRELEKIEIEHNVVIFYACESGSRAWGFESEDSDYDVRFLYLHPAKWYLSIENKRDVIEKPLDGKLDISGWDIKKALSLLKKSNPPLLEWLQSEIVYKEKYSITNQMKILISECYSPRSCFYHYLHMAQGNFREYLQGDEVWVKKYFYVLRPILACKWIENDLGPVPMEFEKLFRKILKDSKLTSAIQDLIQKKKRGNELDRGKRIPVLSDFIDYELKSLSANHIKQTDSIDIIKLDELFHQSLKEVWDSNI